MKKLWDISPLITPDGLLFPGDVPYRVEWQSRFSDGSPVSLCSISLSPHIGAHADAPLHYAPDAQDISGICIEPFIGPCQVIHAIDCSPMVLPLHLQHAPVPLPERVLIRSRIVAQNVWDPGFIAISPDTVSWLHGQGVKLIGIDAPSVDPADSEALPAHKKLHELDMRVLENLVLDDVPEGGYELIALPLKLAGACASPVRAVLRSYSFMH